MAKQPSYPEDAPVGAAAGGRDDKDGSPAGSEPKAGDSGRKKHLMTGAAIGIGSAAIVAALLYANRSRKNDRGGG